MDSGTSYVTSDIYTMYVCGPVCLLVLVFIHFTLSFKYQIGVKSLLKWKGRNAGKICVLITAMGHLMMVKSIGLTWNMLKRLVHRICRIWIFLLVMYL